MHTQARQARSRFWELWVLSLPAERLELAELLCSWPLECLGLKGTGYHAFKPCRCYCEALDLVCGDCWQLLRC